MSKGYLAGSLFSEAEVNQRLLEGKKLRKATPEIDWYNPIEAPCNDKSKLPTAEDIFLGDTKEILSSSYIIADLSNNDPGVMMELGIAWGLQYAYHTISEILAREKVHLRTEAWYDLFERGIKPRDVHAVLSDIRIGTAHNYKGIYIPMSFNQFVIGGIEDMGGSIHSSFDEAVENLRK